jgi:AcrR family transcriptional regulator
VSIAATLIARALDGSVEPPADAVSDRVLDAALALTAASGVRHLTMEDVAKRAGVGRMTVYRRFGDRGRLVEALVVREGRRCLEELGSALPPDAPIDEQVAAGFVTAVRLAREHPLLSRLARIEPDEVLRALVDDGMFALSRAWLAARLQASQRAGVLATDVDVHAAAELLVRLGLSFVLLEDSVLPLDDDTAARELARRLIGPMLG